MYSVYAHDLIMPFHSSSVLVSFSNHVPGLFMCLALWDWDLVLVLVLFFLFFSPSAIRVFLHILLQVMKPGRSLLIYVRVTMYVERWMYTV